MKVNEVEKLFALIEKLDQKDWVDIIGIFAPLILSIVTILFAVYTTIILPKKTKFSVTLYWDDLICRFVVLIINQGKTSIIIDKVRLFIYKDGKEKKLGERRCICSDTGKVIVIEPGQAFSFIPIRGSIYDLFGYKGHYFDVTDDIKSKNVYIEAIDIQGEKSKQKTEFTLGEIDENIIYQNEEGV